jgi:hypothetical protein
VHRLRVIQFERLLGLGLQAFSHVALVNSAMNLREGAKPAEQPAEKKVA